MSVEKELRKLASVSPASDKEFLDAIREMDAQVWKMIERANKMKQALEAHLKTR